MFRPNRIGPRCAYDADAAVWNVNMTGDTANAVSIFPKLRITTPQESVYSERFQDSVQLNAGGGLSLGIPFNGSFEKGDSMLFSFCGSAQIEGARPAVVRPFICRPVSGTLSTATTADQNQSIKPFFLPCLSQVTQSATDADIVSQASVETEVIAGNFNGSTGNTLPLILGWNIVNTHSAALTFGIDVSMSGYRYTTDIKTHDPNR